ncbi:MAG: restriction endonuclease [Planctomycetota bacterium]|nr:restriction endonuclease [Planctomycetota bacterium]
MGLSKSQAAIWQKSKTLGSGGQAVRLTDEMCAFLLSIIVDDLGLQSEFSDLPKPHTQFYTDSPLSSLTANHKDPKNIFERLVGINEDADTYFACLCALHKARLKYERILSTQPIPTLEQVGPRGLLQYGKLSGNALAGFLFWRKWFFDIDNRAGQETGYLFEPIIANAIGGTPAPSSKSPVKRKSDNRKGRQVDCILDNKAYELKIRVTIAASGQGRWQEELDFPTDCEASGFQPVLVCMDGTRNSKIDELILAFEAVGGAVYVGEAAWKHLDDLAGPTMAQFIEKYVRAPIQDLLSKASNLMPDLVAKHTGSRIEISIGSESLKIRRGEEEFADDELDVMPDDAADEIES